MKLHKKTIMASLVASLETSIILAPLGILFFYPLVLEYNNDHLLVNLGASMLCMLVCSAGIVLLILGPATAILENIHAGMSRKELMGALGTISMVMVLAATLVYKGFTRPGDTGKLLLFGLLMSIMAVTWTYTHRYFKAARKAEDPTNA